MEFEKLKVAMLAAKTDEDIDGVFDTIFDTLLVSKERAQEILAWLRQHVAEVHTEILLTALRLSFMARHQLPEWTVLRDFVVEDFKKREPEEWERLLWGLLEPVGSVSHDHYGLDERPD